MDTECLRALVFLSRMRIAPAARGLAQPRNEEAVHFNIAKRRALVQPLGACCSLTEGCSAAR